MKRNILMMSMALAAFTFAAQKVSAQSRNCAAHAAVTERLAVRYGESRQVIALGADNAVIEIFASADSGTWTITMTRAGGPTCLVAAGENFQHVAEDLPIIDEGT